MAHRSRPVAGLPPLDPAALAKAWLLQLIDAAPLAAVPAIPAAALASDGPAFCAAVLAALGDDAALDGLPGADAAGLSGATTAAAAIAAVEALRQAIAAQLYADPAALDRLAHVCSRVAAAAAAA